MKVLSVGAGMQGQVITWNLGRNPAVTEIVVVDHDEKHARFVAGQVGNGKAKAMFINASDSDAVAKAGGGAKLIVNAVIPQFNTSIMQACLKCDAAYQHMARGQTQTQTIDEADLAFVGSGMASKAPVTLKDGSKVRPIDVFVATLPLNPPAEELARLALAGEISDYGVVTVDCIGEKDGKPATVGYNVFPPDIKYVNSLIPGGTSVSYGTSTPSSIYAEFIIEGKITDKGMICPEELPRTVRDAFIAELGVRNMPVTRKDVVIAN